MEEMQIITTVDEDGNEINLKLCDIVTVDEQEYALLLQEDVDIDDEDAEIVLMRLVTVGDEYAFEEIEDQDEFDLVAQAIIDDSEENSDEDED